MVDQSPDYCPLDGGPRIATTCGSCGVNLVMTGVEHDANDARTFVWTEGQWCEVVVP